MDLDQREVDKLMREIKKYDNFITQINLVAEKYIAKFPELVNELAALRISINGQPSMVSIFDSLTENIADLQLAKTAWRKVAHLLHPDRGGSPILFSYAHCLYKSADYQALNQLYEALLKNEIDVYTSMVRQKLNALYEVQKSKVGYRVFLAHLLNNQELASSLIEKSLIKSINNLKRK